jgi:PKD repeat protein
MKQVALISAIAMCVTMLFSCAKKPKACFTFSREKVKVGDTLTLQNCSTNFVYSDWVFPGGGTNTQANPRIKINSSGPFQVSLTVSNDSRTETDILSKEIVVLP